MDLLEIGVTGGTGYLGKNIIKYLAAKGCRVRCLARKKPDDAADRNDNVEYFAGDILKPETLVPFLNKLDVCIHLAAFVDYGTRKQYREVNVKGTKILCDLILQINPGCRFVYCSSITVLKRRKFFGIADSDYAKSKYRGQKYIEKKRDESELKLTVVYSGMIYGPGDRKFLPSTIRYLSEKKLIFLSGGEKNSPLIFIDDLCDLFYRICINSISGNKDYIGVKYENEGIHEFYRLTALKTGNPEPVKKLPKFLLFVPAVLLEEIWQLFRIKKAPPLSKRVVDLLSINFKEPAGTENNDLGWIPKTGMNEGLDKALLSLKQ